MDNDRKYRQRGYMEGDRERSSEGRRYEDRPRPKLPLDVTGPRLPRMVQSVVASRCYNCAVTLPQNTDFRRNCPKCGVALHCCKQCAHFEPSKRFQCLKPVPVRVAVKDQANECEFFSPRVTVARDANSAATQSTISVNQAPRNPHEARAAFDSLFKK